MSLRCHLWFSVFSCPFWGITVDLFNDVVNLEAQILDLPVPRRKHLLSCKTESKVSNKYYFWSSSVTLLWITTHRARVGWLVRWSKELFAKRRNGWQFQFTWERNVVFSQKTEKINGKYWHKNESTYFPYCFVNWLLTLTTNLCLSEVLIDNCSNCGLKAEPKFFQAWLRRFSCKNGA